EAAEVDAGMGIGDDEGIVEVAQIMEHRTAAGKPAHNGDAVGSDKGSVDLGQRVLVAADDDGGGVAPEHETVVGQHPHGVLFSSQVEVRVGFVANETEHNNRAPTTILQ